MNGSLLIFSTILIIVGTIYYIYILLVASRKKNGEGELQITSKEILEQMCILHKQKKYNIVENLAKNYLETKGEDDGIRILLTKSLHNSGKIYEAIEQATILIKHQPKNFDMQIFMANCYMETDNPMKATTILQEVLEKDLNNPTAIKQLAQIYLNTHQTKSALKMYKKLGPLLESNQEKANNKSILAEIYIGFKDFDLAIKEYEQILEIYPADVDVKKRLLELYKETSRFDSMIILATEIAEKFTNNSDGLLAMKMLMDIYSVMNNYDQALRYANLIKMHPLSNPIDSGENIAKILLNEGKIVGAIDLLNSLLEEDFQNIKLKKLLAKAQEKNNNFKEAISIYEEILEVVNSEDIQQVRFEMSSIYSNWAMYLFMHNDSETSFKYFTLAIKYSPQNSYIYYCLGNINKLIKNFNEAIVQYKKAIELNSENSEYHYALAECYESIDSIYEQKKALSECLLYNPNNSKAHYKLGIICEIQKDQKNAILHMKKAVEADGSFIAAKHKLALLLEHIGDIEGAIKIYESILSLEPNNEEVLNNLKMLAS